MAYRHIQRVDVLTDGTLQSEVPGKQWTLQRARPLHSDLPITLILILPDLGPIAPHSMLIPQPSLSHPFLLPLF